MRLVRLTRPISAWGRGLAAIGLLCAAAPTAAQSPSPPEPGESDDIIVVTGETEPPPREQVFEQARELSRVGRYQLYEEGLPRFETPLCPAVFGLRDDYAAAIIADMRANAARLEIATDAEGCTPNLLVAFLDESGSFLSEFERRLPQMFRMVPASEREELLRASTPVRVWNNITLRWTGAGPPPPGWPKLRPSVRGQLNRNFMPEAKVIMSSVVLFEREAVVGMTLTQLADYATMRGLSHTRPANGDEPMATILAMFEDDTDGLTAFDIGYLRSLYDAESNLSAAARFLRIRRRAQDATDAEDSS